MAASIPNAPGPDMKEENLAFRAELLHMIQDSEEFAQAVNLKCSQDLVFWFNALVWTQNPKDFPKNPKQPVILFPDQEEFVLCLDRQIEIGEPLLLEKSREQLATVIMSAYALWRLFYRSNCAGLIGSARKDLVDGKSYSMSILPKCDYVIANLPDRLLPDGWDRNKPGICRRDMHIQHPSKDPGS